MKSQMVGQRYRIKSLIGEGGMASVYAAIDEKLDREVAIKILHQHLARNQDIRDRFLLEARTVSTLDHPNILKVYDFSGLDAEQLWIVTEILHGVDLAEYVKRFPKNRLHPLVCALIAREVCRALHEVHKLKIVHRDVKPENIMVLHTGGVKLMDFGIAKVHRANATQTGTFMGSPSYMSPEQIRGADVDVRADIYSLCVLLYEILTGSLPYSGHTTAEVINRIMMGRYTPPDHLIADLPAALHTIISKGLQNTKEDRFSSIAEMAGLLDDFIHECKFGESRLELERFVLHRPAFEKRLKELSFHPSPEALTRIEDTHLEGPRRLRSATRGPQDTERFTQGPLSPSAQPRGDRPKELTRSKFEAETPSMPSPSGDKAPLAAKPRKIFIREYAVGDQIRREPNTTFYLTLLLGAIALVFLIGGENLIFRLKRDANKISQTWSPSPATSPKGEETAPPPRTVPEDKRPQAMDPILVENQNVTIDAKNPPKVSRPDTSVVRPNRPTAASSRPPNGRPDSAPSKRPTVAVLTGDIRPVSNTKDKAPMNDAIPQESPREKGILRIAALPAAEILVDGKAYGTTNDKVISSGGLKLDPGQYQLKLKRKGYRPEEQNIVIKSGEIKQLSVSLTRTIELVEFTVRSNRLPAQVYIEDLKNQGRKKEIPLTRSSMVFNLKPGQYRVQVSFGKDMIQRTIELAESERSITFNADFK